MAAISDTWFDERVKAGIATKEQCTTMESYLNSSLSTAEAARLITTAVCNVALKESCAEDVVEELCQLWGFIIDVILEWPSSHTSIIALLGSISRLPQIPLGGENNNNNNNSLGTFKDDSGTIREPELWGDLPKFWNLLSDYWDSIAAWRNSLLTKSSSSSAEKPADSSEWININAFAAAAFKDGPFKDMRLLGGWGCYILKETMSSNGAIASVDFPAAKAWLRLAGTELHSFYLEEDKGAQSLTSWEAWINTARGISNDGTVNVAIREDAADIASQLAKVHLGS